MNISSNITLQGSHQSELLRKAGIDDKKVDLANLNRNDSLNNIEEKDRKASGTYNNISRLNLSAPKITMDKVNGVLSNLLGNMKKNAGQAIMAQGNINPRTASALLGV